MSLGDSGGVGMNVALIGPDFEENLSLRYLASSLRQAGHCPSLIQFNTVKDTESAARAARGLPLVGLSLSFQVRAREFFALACRLKCENPGVVIVAGGHFASCAADEILRDNPDIDAIVAHEGERAIVELAEACNTHPACFDRILGLVYRRSDGSIIRSPARPAECNLDGLPEPDRSGPTPLCAGIPTAYMLGSRGCIGSCTYCCITTLHRLAPGPAFRQRSPEKIAEEMSHLYRDKRVRHFVFHDDNFLTPSTSANQRRIDALHDALLCRGVKNIAFTIKCRPCDVDQMVLAKLRTMGLIRVFLGIETATAEGLGCLGRGHTLDQGERALSLCDQLGISGQFNMLMFHPASTVSTIRSDLAFMRRHRQHPINFGRAEIYAGTALERRMIDEGRTVGDYLGRSYTLADPVADLAWDLAARVFYDRCWSTASLMQMAIGLDHLAALTQRCYRGPWTRSFRREVGCWLVEVNLGLLALLERVVDLAEQCGAKKSLGLGVDGMVDDLRTEERHARGSLLDGYWRLRESLYAHTKAEGRVGKAAPSWLRYAAAVVLMTGAGACSTSLRLRREPYHQVDREETPDGGPSMVDIGLCEYEAPPLFPRHQPDISISQDIESRLRESSGILFEYLDKSKTRLPDNILVSIKGRISPAGILDEVQIEDLSGLPDTSFLAGLKDVLKSIPFPASSKGISIDYKITFELR
jgi:anaerobic magnesium-protoporphyrin IX monomethyl ester cyclase